MKTHFTIRFVLAGVFISAGCWFLLSGLFGVGPCFGLSLLLFMPRSELTDAIPRREMWLGFMLLFFLILLVVASRYFTPASVSDAAHRFIRHPAFVGPLWLFMLWGLFRHYQMQKAAVHA